MNQLTWVREVKKHWELESCPHCKGPSIAAFFSDEEGGEVVGGEQYCLVPDCSRVYVFSLDEGWREEPITEVEPVSE